MSIFGNLVNLNIFWSISVSIWFSICFGRYQFENIFGQYQFPFGFPFVLVDINLRTFFGQYQFPFGFPVVLVDINLTTFFGQYPFSIWCSICCGHSAQMHNFNVSIRLQTIKVTFLILHHFCPCVFLLLSPPLLSESLAGRSKKGLRGALWDAFVLQILACSAPIFLTPRDSLSKCKDHCAQ